MRPLMSILAVTLLAGCETAPIDDEMNSRPHRGLIALCQAEDPIVIVEGVAKRWCDTRQCEDAGYACK